MSEDRYVLVRHKSFDIVSGTGSPSNNPFLWPWDRELPEGWEVIRTLDPEEEQRFRDCLVKWLNEEMGTVIDGEPSFVGTTLQRLQVLELWRSAEHAGHQPTSRLRSLGETEGELAQSMCLLEGDVHNLRTQSYSRIQKLEDEQLRVIERLDMLDGGLVNIREGLSSRLDALDSATDDIQKELHPLVEVKVQDEPDKPPTAQFWTCKVGPVSVHAERESSARLCRAVIETFEHFFHEKPLICESGWGEDPVDAETRVDCKTIIIFGESGTSSYRIFDCRKSDNHPGKHAPGNQRYPEPADPLDDPFSHETACDLIARFHDKTADRLSTERQFGRGPAEARLKPPPPDPEAVGARTPQRKAIDPFQHDWDKHRLKHSLDCNRRWNYYVSCNCGVDEAGPLVNEIACTKEDIEIDPEKDREAEELCERARVRDGLYKITEVLDRGDRREARELLQSLLESLPEE